MTTGVMMTVVDGPGRERRLSGSKVGHAGPGPMSQRVLRPGSDVEDALHDALVSSCCHFSFDWLIGL